MQTIKLLVRTLLLLALASSVSSCDPQIYGSVGMSSWGGGYNSGPRMGGSISIGGCLTCR